MRLVVLCAAVAVAVIVWRSRHGVEEYTELKYVLLSGLDR